MVENRKWGPKGKLKTEKQAAGRYLCIAAGVLLWTFGGGCGNADRAIPFSVGESLTEAEDKGSDADIGTWNADETSGMENGPTEHATELYIYVCGAVKNPGVVVLPEGSRCNDALEAAGGFAANAAREAVNLAELLTDGMQLYFPTGEEYKTEKDEAEASQAGLININTAEEAVLCTLPGIGEAKAKSIVAYRKENGDFQTAEDIMQVPGIKESAFSQIKDLITVK